MASELEVYGTQKGGWWDMQISFNHHPSLPSPFRQDSPYIQRYIPVRFDLAA
jgi:hypothetical protein